MKMEGVSRDGGTKEYTIVLENDIATRLIPIVSYRNDVTLKKM